MQTRIHFIFRWAHGKIMIFRLCLCCFGCNPNSPNDSQRLLTNQTTPNANKNEVYTASKAISNYKAALSGKRSNLKGSNTHLTGSVTNLGGSNSHLTGSVTNLRESNSHLTGSVTNLKGSNSHLTGKGPNLAASCINLSGSYSNLSKIKPYLTGSYNSLGGSKTNLSLSRHFIHPASILRTEIGSDLEKKTLKIPTASGNPMTLPIIMVGSSSSRSITMGGSSESTTNLGVKTLPKTGKEIRSLSSSPKMANKWLKSQSMMDITYTSYTESTHSVKSTDDLARKYGLDTSLYGNTHLSKSVEAVNKGLQSMDEFVNENGFIDLPNGTIHFIPSYNSDTRKLSIQIEKIEGLAPKGFDRSKYDCIIKFTMLPNEKHIKFSKAIPAYYTLDLEECFIFNVKDPLDKVLRISIYEVERLGKYEAIGHALFYVIDALTHEQKTHALKLYNQSMPDIQAGSIKITLKYDQKTELLNVSIDEAFNLPLLSGKYKSYVKLSQYNSGSKVKELRSLHISATTQFRYRFTVNLNIDSNALENSAIVISVKMHTFLRDILIGRVILGPFFYAEYGRTLTPWGRALINQETVSHIFRLYQ